MTRYLCAALGLVLAAGCAHSVQVLPYSDKSRNKGVVYALPRALLKVTVPYTIEQKSKMDFGHVKELDVAEAHIRKPVIVEAAPAPDLKNLMVLTGQGISDDWLLDSSLGFRVDQHLMISSLEASVQDKGIELARATVSAAVDIAKLATAAAAGPGDPGPDLKMLLHRIHALYREDASKLAVSSDPAKIEKLATLRKELEQLTALVATYEEGTKDRIESVDLTYTAFVDPAACPAKDGAYECVVQAKELPKVKAGIPAVKLRLALSAEAYERGKRAYFSQGNASETGIVYRVGEPVTVAVSTGGELPAFEQQLVLPQFGRFGVVDVSAKAFGNRTTTVSFDASGLREYRLASESKSEKAVAALGESAKALAAARAELEPTSKAEQELADLKAQTELIQAQIALERAKAELEAARRGGP